MAEKASASPRPASRPVSTRRAARVAEKLQQKIRDKEYYEAHQTYRVLYQRYKAQGKETEALSLLYDGALLLLQHEQWSSGSDLGMLLIAHLKEHKTPVSDEWLDKISTLFCQYTTPPKAPPKASPTAPPTSATTSTTAEQMDISPAAAEDVLFEVVPEVDSQESLLRAALKWSNMVAVGDEWKYGHPKLHKVAATEYWKVKQYGKAREHFLYAQQPQEFGNMLVELATTFGYSGEADLFIAQAVLQLLVLRDRKGGLTVFNSYTRKHPKFKSDNPPYLHHPTLNFVWFLLSACKDRSREVFNCLKINYAPTIQRDPSFEEYLDKIGEAFFVPPNQPRPQTGGPGPSGMFGLGGAAGGLIEGILNSIIPQAVSMAGSVGATVSGTQGPSQANITVTPGNQTQHIHFGTVPMNVPPQGEFPEGGIGAEIQFQFPPGDFTRFIRPQGIRFGSPPRNVPFQPPHMLGVRNRPPGLVNIRHVHHRPPQQNPHPRFNPQGPVNIHINPPQGSNVRFGPAHPGQISVVRVRMEGVPVQIPGVPLGMGNGPVITPAQRQLYQQHTQQQQSGGSEGTQNSTPGAGEHWSTQPPPSNDDMELD